MGRTKNNQTVLTNDYLDCGIGNNTKGLLKTVGYRNNGNNASHEVNQKLRKVEFIKQLQKKLEDKKKSEKNNE